MNLERGLIVAGLALLVGIVLLLAAVNQWRLAGFGRLDYAHTMRLVVPGMTLTALGFQTVLELLLPEAADDETTVMEKAAFDAYAADYDAGVEPRLSLSGESKDYFTRARIQWTASRLAERGHHATERPGLRLRDRRRRDGVARTAEASAVTGVDASSRASLSRVVSTMLATTVEFPHHRRNVGPSGTMIVPTATASFTTSNRPRLRALTYVNRSLSPRGYFALWETIPGILPRGGDASDPHSIVTRSPFPRRTPGDADNARFDVVHTDFLFFFPRVLAPLRPLEARLAAGPAGAQYLCSAASAHDRRVRTARRQLAHGLALLPVLVFVARVSRRWTSEPRWLRAFLEERVGAGNRRSRYKWRRPRGLEIVQRTRDRPRRARVPPAGRDLRARPLDGSVPAHSGVLRADARIRRASGFREVPAGHALMLVPGMWVGLPGLMPALLAGVAGGLIFWLARRLSNVWTALLTWLLWTTSPAALIWATTYFSESTSLVMWLAAACATLLWLDTARVRYLLVASAALAWGFEARPLTMIALAAPLIFVIVRRAAYTRRWQPLVGPVLIAMLVLAVGPLWNRRPSARGYRIPTLIIPRSIFRSTSLASAWTRLHRCGRFRQSWRGWTRGRATYIDRTCLRPCRPRSLNAFWPC